MQGRKRLEQYELGEPTEGEMRLMIEIRKPRMKVDAVSDERARFIMEPLERGFGHTLGNTMRRVLLSSLPGAAVTTLRIDGVAHEFGTIKGVREDVTDVVLNIKELVLRMDGLGPVTMRIAAKGPKTVKASDIEYPSEIEIMNPDLHIATLNKDAKLEMELTVEAGRGYVSAERNKKAGDPIGTIPVDSLFTPVAKVTYEVEHTRVGQRTDYDRVVLDVMTNGATSPADAVSQGSKIVNDHMELFMEQSPEQAEGTIFVPDEAEKNEALDAPIEDLELSVRSYNCLKRQGINTLADLVNETESGLMNIRNFGAKSIDEVKAKLAGLELSLKSG